jgi:ribonuclease PH
MLVERNIPEEWVWRTISHPDKKRRGADNNMHYAKAIKEYDKRILRVVVNTDFYPNRIVTIFFDRRLSKKVGR